MIDATPTVRYNTDISGYWSTSYITLIYKWNPYGFFSKLRSQNDLRKCIGEVFGKKVILVDTVVLDCCRSILLKFILNKTSFDRLLLYFSKTPLLFKCMNVLPGNSLNERTGTKVLKRIAHWFQYTILVLAWMKNLFWGFQSISFIKNNIDRYLVNCKKCLNVS